MVKIIKKLLPFAEILNTKIETPDLKVRNYILVDHRILYKGKEIIFEYNGPHHYQSFSYTSLTENKKLTLLKNQIERDKWLRKYCKNNKITLIEIDGRLVQGSTNIKLSLLHQLKLLGVKCIN